MITAAVQTDREIICLPDVTNAAETRNLAQRSLENARRLFIEPKSSGNTTFPQRA